MARSENHFQQPLEWLLDEIDRAMVHWLEQSHGEDFWREPIVGVASADDPLFEKLQQVIDPKHAMPRDLLPDARSVIVFFLPFKLALGQENDQSGFFAARSWAKAYVATNDLIGHISVHLRKCLEGTGYQASTLPATHNFDEEKLISLWSHKHIAFIAGLGTFGLHHQIISRAGCCGRLGSLVTSMPLPVTSRPAEEWCLAKAGYACQACVSQCRYGALEEVHFDRHLCYAQCLRNDAHYDDLPLVDVCGKCGCEVPCSYGVPEKLV